MSGEPSAKYRKLEHNCNSRHNSSSRSRDTPYGNSTSRQQTESPDRGYQRRLNTCHDPDDHASRIVGYHADGNFRSQPGGNFRSQPGGNFRSQHGGNFKNAPDGNYRSQSDGNYRSHPDGNYRRQPDGNYRSLPDGNYKSQPHDTFKNITDLNYSNKNITDNNRSFSYRNNKNVVGGNNQDITYKNRGPADGSNQDTSYNNRSPADGNNRDTSYNTRSPVGLSNRRLIRSQNFKNKYNLNQNNGKNIKQISKNKTLSNSSVVTMGNIKVKNSSVTTMGNTTVSNSIVQIDRESSTVVAPEKRDGRACPATGSVDRREPTYDPNTPYQGELITCKNIFTWYYKF